MGGVWVMDLREGGSGTDRCLGEKRKEQKKRKKPTLKKGCPEKEGLRQVSGWNIMHVPALYYGWFIYDISSGYSNLPSN